MRRVIDLVIPTFREERYLPKCLNSIKKQTLFDKINVIIADYNPLKKTETFEIAKYIVKSTTGINDFSGSNHILTSQIPMKLPILSSNIVSKISIL
ncbi:MAG: glycosyltransferase, partial [Nitrososphaeraceae archaeon]|nr:glycosyltransferase [Nitrososphaeraceae archaeon]